MIKIYVALLALLFTGVSSAQLPPNLGPGSVYVRTGPVHRQIAETSPVATVVIEQTAPKAGMKQFKIAVRATVHNTTGHELRYVNPSQNYDVTDRKTGKRAPNTDAGCYGNFFMDCYTPSFPVGVGPSGPPTYVIPPHGSKEIEPLAYIDMDYKLDPGEYTVVGYFCATEREGPECFKSNRITITIPPPAANK
jgi:hypothetical protein